MERLQKMFDLPDLGHNGDLAYATKSDQTVVMIKGVRNRPLTKLKEAALFEEMFIW